MVTSSASFRCIQITTRHTDDRPRRPAVELAHPRLLDRLVPGAFGQVAHAGGLLPAVGDLAALEVEDRIAGGAQLDPEGKDVARLRLAQPADHHAPPQAPKTRAWALSAAGPMSTWTCSPLETRPSSIAAPRMTTS